MQEWTVRRSDWQRPLVVLFCLAFIVVSRVAYEAMDVPLLSVYGLRVRELDGLWTVVGMAMALAPSFWMPVKLERPSMVAYWILYLCVIVPVTWIPFHTLDCHPADYTPFALTYLVCFYLLGLSFRLSRWHVPRPNVPQDAFVFGTFALAVAMTLLVWSTNGFRFDLGLQSMYTRRRAAGETIPMGSALSYVKGNLASAVQPFVFAVGLARRSWILIGLSVFAGVVGFSVDGSKTSAFIPLFLLGLYPLLTKFRNNFGLLFPLATFGLVLVAFLGHMLTKNPAIPVVTTWRLFDVKGLLTGYYWEFFSQNPKTFLSDGILRGFFDNPYPYAAPEQIGLVYFGSSETNSNANLWASAYGDFGVFGMILVTAVLALVFRLIDSMAVNRGFLIPAFLASFLGMKLTDVALDTSILSHGTLAIVLLIYFLPPLTREPRPGPVAAPAGAPA